MRLTRILRWDEKIPRSIRGVGTERFIFLFHKFFLFFDFKYGSFHVWKLSRFRPTKPVMGKLDPITETILAVHEHKYL